MRRPEALAIGAALLCACGGSAPGRPTTFLPIPDGQDDRQAAVAEVGRRAWDAMRAGEPERLLYDELDLTDLLSRGAAMRIRGHRIHLVERLNVRPEVLAAPLAAADYGGVCLQGARVEAASGPLGLRSEAWVFDRLLLIGRRASGQRVAAWIEGVFVYSDAGFAALDLERVEEPRWEHSDLEIAPCDLAIREDLPQIAR